MLRLAASALAGLIFGSGLTISRMIDPAKVLGFLDVAGDWDPSLALVMAGAIPVAAIGFLFARRWRAPAFADAFSLPSRTGIDASLLMGAALFGIGWGLAGFCPGPALAALALGKRYAVLFVVAMGAGIVAADALREIRPATARRSG